MLVRSSARFGLLAALLAHPSWFGSKESASLRAVKADDVSEKINGDWQEFSFKAVNREVYPCDAGCSEDPDSEPLVDNIPPWTVQSSTSCLLLEVIEGYFGGETVFEVYNNEVSLGTTLDIPLDQGSSSCWDDPTACYLDNGVTKGAYLLSRNVEHSIRIIPRRSDFGGVDGGWFRIREAACAPPPTCARSGSSCNPSTRCCSGLVCRQTGAAAPSRCLACARATKFCAKNSDCCSNRCARRNNRCAR